jgi:hypothetical protein
LLTRTFPLQGIVKAYKLFKQGAGHFEHGGTTHAVGKGDVFVLPAAIGTSVFRPSSAVNLLEIALPD